MSCASSSLLLLSHSLSLFRVHANLANACARAAKLSVDSFAIVTEMRLTELRFNSLSIDGFAAHSISIMGIIIIYIYLSVVNTLSNVIVC